jgi:hypothetical protein
VRREFREKNLIIRRPYLHQSRSNHAKRRSRGRDGHFLSAEKAAARRCGRIEGGRVKKTILDGARTDVPISGWIEEKNMSGMMSGDRHRTGGTTAGTKDDGRSDYDDDTDRCSTGELEETVKQIVDPDKSRFGLLKG